MSLPHARVVGILSSFVVLVGVLVPPGEGWRAIPANQAMYAVRSQHSGVGPTEQDLKDAFLPRESLQHIYKFGWCAPDVTTHPYLHKSLNVSLPTWQASQLTYIYLIARKNTLRHLQCVVMKAYVPAKFLFYRSRLPLYYCQGTVFVLMLNTINRYEIHEFFLYYKVNMPMSFVFEFYHPHAL